MEVQPAETAAQGRAVQFGSTEQAQKLAAANSAARIKSEAQKVEVAQARNDAVGRIAADDAFYPAKDLYPALFAQAAQYQIYTQSGTLNALLGTHPSKAQDTDSDDVKPVDSAQGAESKQVDA